MGLGIIVLFIIVMSIGLIMFFKNESGIIHELGILLIAVGFVFGHVFGSIPMFYEIFTSDVQMAKIQNERALIQRTLEENYYPDNLKAALDFNARQKLIKIENENFITKYSTSVVFADTISIPSYKYIPTKKIILE